MTSKTNAAEKAKMMKEGDMEQPTCSRMLSQTPNPGGGAGPPVQSGTKRRRVMKRRQSENLQGESKPKKPKKPFVKKFRKEWLSEEIFKGWLEPIPNHEQKCWCSVCQVILLAGHSELERHASGKKHCELVRMNELKKSRMMSLPEDMLDVPEIENSNRNDNSSEMPTMQLSQDNAVESELVLHVFRDGSSLNMKMEDSEQMQTNLNEQLQPSASCSGITTRTNVIEKTFDLPKKQPMQNTKKFTMTSTIRKIDEEMRSRLLEQLGSDSDDDDFDDDDDLSDPQLVLREMKAEIAYHEKKLLQEKQRPLEPERPPQNTSRGRISDSEEILRRISEKEKEFRLICLREKRRQRFNLYKLRLQEMDAKVRAAELDIAHREELYKLRAGHLKLLITVRCNNVENQ